MQTDLNALARLGLYSLVFIFLLITSYKLEIANIYLPSAIFLAAAFAFACWFHWLKKNKKLDIFHLEIIIVFIIIFLISGIFRGVDTLKPEVFNTEEVENWD